MLPVLRDVLHVGRRYSKFVLFAATRVTDRSKQSANMNKILEALKININPNRTLKTQKVKNTFVSPESNNFFDFQDAKRHNPGRRNNTSLQDVERFNTK